MESSILVGYFQAVQELQFLLKANFEIFSKNRTQENSIGSSRRDSRVSFSLRRQMSNKKRRILILGIGSTVRNGFFTETYLHQVKI